MEQEQCDLVVVGGGPAGLSAAITAASEGLSTTLVEASASLGGQAAQSSCVENYPGFPSGISGHDLMAKFVTQARKFGANIVCPARVEDVKADAVNPARRLVRLDDGTEISARAVILADGLAYRRLPGAKNLGAFVGRGVTYGPPPVDHAWANTCFAVVGGANSAGQAAMHLAAHPDCTVKLIVRGAQLEAGMSQYLVDRIKAAPNVEVICNAQLTEARGDERLEEIVVQCAEGERVHRVDGGVFIFIGSSPRTEWLKADHIDTDGKGFVATGAQLETNLPGVFSAGDVRSGSIKRIVTAVGEGACAVQQVHSYLAEGVH